MIILVYEVVVVLVIAFLFLRVTKSSTEFSHLREVKIPKSCPVRNREGGRPWSQLPVN
jgi:hypothetical protein